MEVQVQDVCIATTNGHSLGACKFSTERTTNHVIVISSATGVLQRYYSKFAYFFAARGIPVYTFDYHGIGKSGGAKAFLKANTSDLISWGQNDQAAVVAFVKKEYSDSKLILVTHSIGGQILGFNPNYHMLDKVILVASQSGYWKDFNGAHKVKMWLFWYAVIPCLTSLFGYFPAKNLGLFENLPKNMVYEWANWGKEREYLMEFYDEKTHLFAHFEIPILSLSFSKDIFAPKNTVDWLAGLYKKAIIHRIHHEAKAGERHLRHFGFFKPWAEDPYWLACLNYMTNGNYTA